MLRQVSLTLSALACALAISAAPAAAGTFDLSGPPLASLPTPAGYSNAVAETSWANPDGSWSIVAQFSKSFPFHLPGADPGAKFALAIVGPDGQSRPMPGGVVWKFLKPPKSFSGLAAIEVIPGGGAYLQYLPNGPRLDRWAVVRMRADGTRDRDFGHQGTLTYRPPGEKEQDLSEIFCDQGGQLYVTGSRGSDQLLRVYRFDGSLRRAFGKLGVLKIKNFQVADIDGDSSRLLLAGWRVGRDEVTETEKIVALGPHGVVNRAFGDRGTLVVKGAPGRREPTPIAILASLSGDFDLYSNWLRSYSDSAPTEFGLEHFAAAGAAQPTWRSPALFAEDPSGDIGDPDVFERRAFLTARGVVATHLEEYYPGGGAFSTAEFALADPQSGATSVKQAVLAAGTAIDTFAASTDGANVLAVTSRKIGKRRADIRLYLVPTG